MTCAACGKPTFGRLCAVCSGESPAPKVSTSGVKESEDRAKRARRRAEHLANAWVAPTRFEDAFADELIRFADDEDLRRRNCCVGTHSEDCANYTGPSRAEIDNLQAENEDLRLRLELDKVGDNEATAVELVDARAKIVELEAQIRELKKPRPEERVDSIGTCERCGYHGPGPAHDCIGRLVNQVKMLQKQRDDVVRGRQELETLNRELAQELEAQLREKMGDKITDESLAILRGKNLKCPYPDKHAADCECEGAGGDR